MDLTTSSIIHSLYVGPNVRQLVEPIFGLFHDQDFAPNLAAWMVFVAAGLAASFLLQIALACARLHVATRHLRKIPNQQEFARDFPAVDVAIMRVPFLRHGWTEFKETLVPGESGATIQNTLRPGEFLNLAEAEHSGLNIRWFQPLPAVFVGIGLLLTFVGLIAALWFASQGISAGAAGDASMKQMQESLIQLLNTATFKFWTSVAGLLSSIALGFVHRSCIARVQRCFEKLCNQIERGMVFLTAELIAQHHLEEARKQAAQLAEFNGQLAFTIGQGVELALKSAMPQIMAQAMEPVATQLREVTGNIGSMNEGALKTMTQDFGKVLQDSAGEELKAVAVALEATRGTLDGVGGRIETATTGFEGAIDVMRRSTELLAARVEGNADRTGTALDKQLEATTEALKAISRNIAEALDGVTDRLRATSQEAGTQFTAQLGTVIDRLNQAADANASAMRDVAEQIRSSASSSSAAMGEGAQAAIEALARAADRMAESVGLMARRIEESSDAAASKLLTTLGTTLSGIEDATAKNGALIADAISKIALASAEATDKVRSDAQAIGAALGEKAQEAGGAAGKIITGAAEGLSSAVGEFHGEIEDLSRSLRSVEERIVGHVDALAGVTRETRETETAMAGAARSLREASEPFARSGQAVADAARSMATQVDKSAAALIEAQAQARKVGEDMQRMVDAATRSWQQYEERFEGVDQALVRTIGTVMDNFKANADAVKEFVNRIDNELGEAVSQFAGNIELLQESAALFEKSTQSLEVASRRFLPQAAE